jgi:CP family cyanate transporter-like MFS transporter
MGQEEGAGPDMAGLPGRGVLLAGIWLVNVCVGLVMFSMAPLVSIVAADLNLSLAAMGSILGAWPLIYMLAALPLGAVVDRIGLRRCITLGAWIVALSALLRGWAQGYASLYAAVALLGLGVPMISIATPKLINYWFGPHERGTATGWYMSGPSVGAMLGLSLTNFVVMPAVGGQWRLVLLMYAGCAGVVAAVWWGVAHRLGPRSPLDREPGRPLDLRQYLRLLNRPIARRVLLLAMGVFMFMHGLNNWVPEILRQAGLNASEAGLWASLPVAITVIGAILIPRMTPAANRPRALMGLFVLGSVAALLLVAPGFGWVAVGLVLLGIARSALWPLTLLCLTESRDMERSELAPAGAMFFTAGELGGVLGPVLIGVLAQATGTFVWPLFAIAAVSFSLALVSLSLERLRRGELRARKAGPL